MKVFQEVSDRIKRNYKKKLVNKSSEVLFENKLDRSEKYFGRDEHLNSVIVKARKIS